jgi:hypothetical protein
MIDSFSISQGICKTFTARLRLALTASISADNHMDVLEYDRTRLVNRCCMPSNTTTATWRLVSPGILQIPSELRHLTIKNILDGTIPVLRLGQRAVQGSWQRDGSKFELLTSWNLAAERCSSANEYLPNEGRGSASHWIDLEGHGSGSIRTSIASTVDVTQPYKRTAKSLLYYVT